MKTVPGEAVHLGPHPFQKWTWTGQVRSSSSHLTLRHHEAKDHLRYGLPMFLNRECVTRAYYKLIANEIETVNFGKKSQNKSPRMSLARPALCPGGTLDGSGCFQHPSPSAMFHGLKQMEIPNSIMSPWWLWHCQIHLMLIILSSQYIL